MVEAVAGLGSEIYGSRDLGGWYRWTMKNGVSGDLNVSGSGDDGGGVGSVARRL